MSAELLKEKIKEILKGIDECEVYSGHGWWETSVGQKFGADKLKEILAAIDEHYQPKGEKSNQLKPCPFCKSALVEAEPGSKYFSHPGGMHCILDGFDMDADGDPNLVAQWNRRAQPAEEVQPVNDLLKQFKEVYPKAMTEFAEQMRSMGITSAPIGNHQASMFKLERAIYDALAAKDTP